MKKLLLIRHTETEYLAKTPGSQLSNDSPLSEKGLQQAKLISEHFKELSPDLLLTSLYKRAQQTAEILNQSWDVSLYKNIALNEFFLSPEGSGQESTEQGLTRALSFLNQFRCNHDCIAAVSHNSLLCALAAGILNMRFSEAASLFKAPGSCHTLVYDWEQGDENWRISDSFVPPQD